MPASDQHIRDWLSTHPEYYEHDGTVDVSPIPPLSPHYPSYRSLQRVELHSGNNTDDPYAVSMIPSPRRSVQLVEPENHLPQTLYPYYATSSLHPRCHIRSPSNATTHTSTSDASRTSMSRSHMTASSLDKALPPIQSNQKSIGLFSLLRRRKHSNSDKRHQDGKTNPFE